MVAMVRKIRRLEERGHGSNSFEHQIEIRLPSWRMLQLAARSILLAVAVLSLPWWGTTVLFRRNAAAPVVGIGGARVAAAVNGPDTASGRGAAALDDVYFLPMLFRDLKREGVFSPGAGKVLFVGAAAGAGHLRLPFLKQNKIEVIGGDKKSEDSVPVNSVDFIFTLDTPRPSDFADRVLKIGGVAVVRLSSDPSEPFKMPANYDIIYIRRFGGSTIVAMRKTASISGGEVAAGRRKRELLTVPEAKKKGAIMSDLEDVLLEPPSGCSKKYLTRATIKYLPDLMGGDTVDGYPRRLFVDVGPPGRNDKAAKSWFTKHYPTRNLQFELIRVETRDGAKVAVPEAEGGIEMSGWLRRTVREEDYVVMKAEAEVVEDLVRSTAVGLVDELFLECRHQWQEEDGGQRKSRRAYCYWECLDLYGSLLDEGVAVRQWWG